MDYEAATDILMDSGVTLEQLAKEIGVSRYVVARARIDPGSEYHRSPPDGWREAARSLARHQIAELDCLVAEL